MASSPGVPTGNYFDKFNSANPLVKFVMKRYLSRLYSLLDRGRVDRVLEVGCGEGEIASRVIARYDPSLFEGFDIDEELISSLQKRFSEHSFDVAYLEELSLGSSYDVALCLEVLEHIPDFSAALDSLASFDADRVIISVPNEPFFRLANVSRLKYLSRLGNTPGHVNNFSVLRLRRLVREAFPGREVRVYPCWIWSFAYVE